jgi:hypothetical protein
VEVTREKLICILLTAALLVITASCAANQGAASPSALPEPTGETRRFTYQGLEIEVTEVVGDRNETYQDDGGADVDLLVITYLTGAKLTIINPDMSDPAFAADGNPHATWGIDYASRQQEERFRITDDTPELDITEDMLGIYNLEASLYIIAFEAYSPE